MTDNVNRPPHYTRGRIEVRDFIADQGLNFNRGSAVKYVSRAGHKDPTKEVEDLRKAIACIEHEIALLDGQTYAADRAERVRSFIDDAEVRATFDVSDVGAVEEVLT